MSYLIEGFKKAFDFKGRASRTQYWMFFLLTTIITIVIVLGIVMTANPEGSNALASILSIIYVLWALAVLIPSLSILIRRLHDINRTGWWFFIAFVPFVGGIWLLVLMLLPTVNEGNRFPN